MMKRSSFSGKCHLFKKLKSDKRAVMLPMFALMFAAMLAFLGLLFDGGRIYFEKRRMQVAADAGAFGGAHELLRSNDEATIKSGGRDDAALNSFTHGQDTVDVQIKHPPDSGLWKDDMNCVEAEIDQNVPTTLMRIVGATTSTVATRAVACVEIYDDAPCVLALYCGAGKPGLEFDGTGYLGTHDCNVVVNSKSDESIRVNGTGGGCPMLQTEGDGLVAYGTGGATLQNGVNNCIACEACSPQDEPYSDIWCMKDPYCSNYLSNTSDGYPGDPTNLGNYPYCEPMPDPWDPTNPPTPDFTIENITATTYKDEVTFPLCVATPITAPCFDKNNKAVADVPPALLLPEGYYSKIKILGGVVRLLCPNPGSGCLFMTPEFTILGGVVKGEDVVIYITPDGPPNKGLLLGANAGVAPNSITLKAPTGGRVRDIEVSISAGSLLWPISLRMYYARNRRSLPCLIPSSNCSNSVPTSSARSASWAICAPVRSPAPRGVAANQAAAAIAPVNRGTVPIPASPIRPVVRPSPSRCRLRPRWAKPSAKWPSSASSSN